MRRMSCVASFTCTRTTPRHRGCTGIAARRPFHDQIKSLCLASAVVQPECTVRPRCLGVVLVSMNSAAHPATRVPASSRFLIDETECSYRPGVVQSTRVLCVSVTLWFHSSAHVSSSVPRRLGVVLVPGTAHRIQPPASRRCRGSSPMRPDAAALDSSIDASAPCLCDSVVPLERTRFVLGISAPRCRSCVDEQRRPSGHARPASYGFSSMRPDAAIGLGSSMDASALCLCDSVVPLDRTCFVLGISAPRCRSCVGEQRRPSSPARSGVVAVHHR